MEEQGEGQTGSNCPASNSEVIVFWVRQWWESQEPWNHSEDSKRQSCVPEVFREDQGQVASVLANIKHTVRIWKCKLGRKCNVRWREDQWSGPSGGLLQSKGVGKKLQLVRDEVGGKWESRYKNTIKSTVWERVRDQLSPRLFWWVTGND